MLEVVLISPPPPPKVEALLVSSMSLSTVTPSIFPFSPCNYSSILSPFSRSSSSLSIAGWTSYVFTTHANPVSLKGTVSGDFRLR